MKTFYLSIIGFFCFLSVARGVESLQLRSGETVTGTIESASSSDNWSFYGETGDRVIICAMKTSGSISGAFIKLYDKDASIESQNSGNPGIDGQLKKTGLYTIAVEAVAHSGTGNYSLTFQKIPGPVSAPGDLDGGTMTPGLTYSGTINDVSDLDAYQFYGQTGDIVKMYALKKSGNMTSLYIKLYPADGGSAESENVGVYGIDHELEKTGLYTAIVEADNHSGTGKYEIEFLKSPATIPPGIYNQSPDNGDIITDGNGSFSWDPLTGITGYDVFFGEDVIEPLGKIGNNLSVPSLLFPEMESGNIYYWRVIAHTPAGDIQGPDVWFQYEKDTTPPADGTFNAVAGSNQVSLSWSGFTDAESGIKSYKLVYNTGGFPVSCSDGAQAYSGTNNVYIHKGLANNTTYYYRLCAQDNAGNISTGVTASATPALSLGPDLTGTWKTLVQTCHNSGKSFKCKIKGKLSVQNIGQQEAKSSIVRYYLSDNSYFESGDTFLKQVATGKIKAGKSKDKAITYSFPKGSSATGKYIIAVIDYRDKVEEADETNNTISIGPLP
jgi:CARDB